MWYPVKKALRLLGEQSGIFPAKCKDLERWKEFAEVSSRAAVEKLYRFWALCSDLDEPADQDIECILRGRLQRFEQPKLRISFINAHKDKIVWVRSDWSAKDIFNYVQWEKYSVEYPFYVVDERNKVRGIAIADGLIFAGALNFATSVDEAEYLYAGGALMPFTDKDVGLLEKYRSELERMISVVGMQPINGGYLVVDEEVGAWRGVRFSRRITLLSKGLSGGYFLLAKL